MKDPIKVTPPKIDTPVEEKAPIKKKGFKSRIPADWDIKVLGEDRIRAYNSVSKEEFMGTILEFNNAMRG